jgi:hypothetical protein
MHPAPRTSHRRHMGPLLPAALLDELFSPQMTWTAARRIEVRRGYASDLDDPRWRHWARGGRLLPEPDRPWYGRIRQLRAEGRGIERVRVLDSPATVGQRYLRWIAPNSAEAGETIRTLPRERADQLRLHDDVWLFEGPGPIVAHLVFDARDVLTGISISRSPIQVTTARACWTRAWQASVGLVA